MFQVFIPTMRAADLKEALSLIAEPGSRILMGGTDLLVQAKEEMVTAERFVDVSGIPELREVVVSAKKVVIGAGVRLGELRRHPVIRSDFPALVSAIDVFASPQIRNRATLTGNIANASPAGDTLPPLYAYDAVLTLRKKIGRRQVALAEFIQGPRKTLLEPGEMITEITLPRSSGEAQGIFIKIGQRKALAISKTDCAVAASFAPNGTVKRIGIALGAVAPVILRLTAAEANLLGKKITPELAAEARRIAIETVRPIDDIRSTASYRRRVTGVIVERALLGLRRLDS
jgi:CO/xanthine dehydrogenase FAD-binding subunit